MPAERWDVVRANLPNTYNQTSHRRFGMLVSGLHVEGQKYVKYSRFAQVEMVLYVLRHYCVGGGGVKTHFWILDICFKEHFLFLGLFLHTLCFPISLSSESNLSVLYLQGHKMRR